MFGLDFQKCPHDSQRLLNRVLAVFLTEYKNYEIEILKENINLKCTK